MECKFCYIICCARHVYELIETLWNVNEGAKGDYIPSNYELIETLWNVNRFSSFNVFASAEIELIETLWNVNTGLLVWFYRRNRN